MSAFRIVTSFRSVNGGTKKELSTRITRALIAFGLQGGSSFAVIDPPVTMGDSDGPLYSISVAILYTSGYRDRF